MSNKLTFEEWFFQCEFHKDGYDCNQVSSANSAWNFAQAQEQKEIEELKKENESLKKKLEKAEEVIQFYANQENWYSHGNDSTIKRRIDLNDGEEFLNYEYGGKRARAYLKENEG